VRRREFIRNGAGVMAGGLLALQVSNAEALLGQKAPAKKRTILVWSEGTAPKDVYPKDISGAVADELKGLRGYEIRTATLTDPDQGVSDAVLSETDVLFWWGHEKHGDVTDATVERIVKRVKEGGMGVVFLHSAHFSKPLKAVLGASGAWSAYVNDGKPQRITVADKNHPIARGVKDFVIPKEERYEEKFIVPEPEAVVFDGFYESTQTRARQGLCWTIGKGRVFYFRPGHEDFPIFFLPEVKRIMRNAALWAARNEDLLYDDTDPAGAAAFAAGEPSLGRILRDAGYGSTSVVAGGEIEAQRLVKAGKGKVTMTPLAAYGVLKNCTAGWYPAPTAATDTTPEPPKRTQLWKIDAPNNKRMAPPLASGGKTTFDPGDKPFGLWVATEGFAGEYVYSEDALQKFIPRFSKGHHKAHVYAAVKTGGATVPNAVLIGFEYSTNDDNQEVVVLVENVRPA
jgi:trehalose utilization protein